MTLDEKLARAIPVERHIGRTPSNALDFLVRCGAVSNDEAYRFYHDLRFAQGTYPQHHVALGEKVLFAALTVTAPLQ